MDILSVRCDALRVAFRSVLHYLLYDHLLAELILMLPLLLDLLSHFSLLVLIRSIYFVWDVQVRMEKKSLQD